MQIKPFLYFLTLFTLYILPVTDIQAAPQIKEYHVKAKYINGFTKFIHWPDNTFNNANESLHLCVLGDNPFGETLNILMRKHNARTTRKSNPQKVFYLRRGEDVTHCHLLYFSDSEESYFYQVLSQIKGKPILTISSIRDFAISGGMIQFYVRDNKVRFLIDPQTLRDNNLEPDANLLRVADIVHK